MYVPSSSRSHPFTGKLSCSTGKPRTSIPQEPKNPRKQRCASSRFRPHSFQNTTSPSSFAPEVSSESYESLRAKLHALLGGPTDNFFERIGYSYLASVKDSHGDLTIIEKEIHTVLVLTSAAHQLQDQVLQAKGISQDWERHERLRKCLQEVSAGLEDMMCLVMVDVGDLKDSLTTRKLRGQIAGDLVANL